jgi:hypothetical protein
MNNGAEQIIADDQRYPQPLSAPQNKRINELIAGKSGVNPNPKVPKPSPD